VRQRSGDITAHVVPWVRRRVGDVAGSDVVRRVARSLNPVVASPSAPLESYAALDALSPSLMPRTSALLGMGMGLNALAARVATRAAEQVVRRVVTSDAALGRRLLIRAVVGAAGGALATLPERSGERIWRATLRSSGMLLRAGAAGGAVHDIGDWAADRYPTQRAVQPVVASLALTGGLVAWGAHRLATREAAIQPWPVPQTTTIAKSLAVMATVTSAGSGLDHAINATFEALHGYLRTGRSKRLVAGVANAGLWAAIASAAYHAGVAYVGRTNDMVEAAYANPPLTPLVSGSPDSLIPFWELGQQGRQYVTDVVTPELIEEVMDEPGTQPIRVYVGFNSEPVYAAGRAEMALAELERVRAFDRSHLLLVSPTGTGWVDQTMIESAEFLTRGDIATVCVQYGRYPSFLAVQKVALGRAQFRLLLWGIRQRLAERSPERRPTVFVFGESLGAWASSDVVMYQGITGFDHYGIDRALWVGLPWLARWSRSGMTRHSSRLVPEGSVGVFDRHEQLAALTREQRDRMRAVILSHDNDPIALMGPDLFVQRPAWLHGNGQRGRGVPDTMEWIPMITGINTVIDAANAMVTVPGEFGSYGHDYRADMARFVRDAYHLQATEWQMERIERTLRVLDLDRVERARATTAAAAPLPPAQRAAEPGEMRAGVPLRPRVTRGARWGRSARSGHGGPPGDPDQLGMSRVT
jgi:uncharacterized membrane protein